MRPSVDVSLYDPLYSQVQGYLLQFQTITGIMGFKEIDIPLIDQLTISLLPLIGLLACLAFRKFVSRGLFFGKPDRVMVAKRGRGVPPGYSLHWRYVAITAQVEK